MANHLFLDMDGTLYNLYNIPNWLQRLEKGDMTIFVEEGYERKSIEQIKVELVNLYFANWEIDILTWAPKGVKRGSAEFTECLRNKCAWARRIGVTFNAMYLLEYGEPKSKAIIPFDNCVLVDDNAEIRKEFRAHGGRTINASRGYISELRGLLTK